MILTLLSVGMRAMTAVSRDPQRTALRSVADELRALDRPQPPAPTSSR